MEVVEKRYIHSNPGHYINVHYSFNSNKKLPMCTAHRILFICSFFEKKRSGKKMMTVS